MTDVQVEHGSFRDPANRVFYSGDRVLRSLDHEGAEDWKFVASKSFLREAMQQGRVVRTEEYGGAGVEFPEARDSALILEHERIPFITYPYEWTFEMLRDAAALHLDLLLAALAEDCSTKDGYSFNVQFVGSRPVFIDVGSIEKVQPGPWPGYRQFCQTFLFPLMLDAYVGIPFQRYLRGNLEGFDVADMRRILSGLRTFRPGVLQHVLIHDLAGRRMTGESRRVQQDLGAAGFSKELVVASTKKLSKLIGRLHSQRNDSAWRSYRDTCSYSDGDRQAKEAFVRKGLEASAPLKLVWDLGANDGAYSRLAAEHADFVVAADYDDVTVDALYRSLRQDRCDTILPIVLDLTDPSPARGWRGAERRSFLDRARPDLVLGLALIHHLAIGANVPLPEVVDLFRSLDARVIIEFVDPQDPMAQRLLANKRAGLFPDYRIESFEALVEQRFTVADRLELPSGTRTLYALEPR